MNLIFEKISPPQKYKRGYSRADFERYDWDRNRRVKIVKIFKALLKRKFRKLQFGQCCYCRRDLSSDDQSVHIEHILEKSIYPIFSFEINNLALCCSACNSEKNKYFLRKKKKIESSGLGKCYCPMLDHKLINTDLPSDPNVYRWIHPHFDEFSDNLEIESGWIFKPKTKKGWHTKRGLKLNNIAKIERRAMSARARGAASNTLLRLQNIDSMNGEELDALVREITQRKQQLTR